MLQLKTINDIFFLVATSSQPRAVLYMDAAGKWQAFSGMQMYQRVRTFAEALGRWGIQKGDRIAILGENRWEWAVADFAALAIGAVDVPIYPTLTAEQIGVLLADSGARVAVVSSRQQYDKVATVRSQTAIEKIVVMDDEGADISDGKQTAASPRGVHDRHQGLPQVGPPMDTRIAPRGNRRHHRQSSLRPRQGPPRRPQERQAVVRVRPH